MLRVRSVICRVEITSVNGFSERGSCLLRINEVGLRFLFCFTYLLLTLCVSRDIQ